MIPKETTSFAVKAKPNFRKTEILSFDALKKEAMVCVNAKADKGLANAELERFFTKYFGREVKLVHGKTSSKKLFKVSA